MHRRNHFVDMYTVDWEWGDCNATWLIRLFFLYYIALMVSPVLCPSRTSTARKTMLKRISVVSLVVACT